MSAIAAIFQFDCPPTACEASLAQAEGAISAMTSAMADCGRDGIAHRIENGAAFGICALDATAAGSAKRIAWHEETRLGLVMDGYLANWEELRREFAARNIALRSEDDAELVLQAFLLWGTDCAARLDGEFSCVIWNGREQRVHLLRDHHGLRPLFYWRDDNRLVVASHLAGLVAGLGKPLALNHAYIDELAADVSYTATDTIWQGVYRPPHASITTVNREGISHHRYWQLPQDVPRPYLSDSEYHEAYRAMFAECVRRASRSHRPVACEVSGGLDSTAVFAMAAHLHQANRLPAPGVAAHTLAGPAGTRADEIAYARAAAEKAGVVLHEHALHLPQFQWFIERAREICDVPPRPNAIMSLNLDRAAAQAGSRVLLSGIGGDQWLDGTRHHYRELMDAGNWRRLARQYRAEVRALGHKGAAREFLRRGPGSYVPFQARKFVGDMLGIRQTIDEINAPWLNPASRASLEKRRAAYESTIPADYRKGYKLRKLMYPRWASILDTLCLQRGQSGLELRSPMMSRAFIEFSTTTPEHIRVLGAHGKMVHRRALADLLPEEVALRGSKAEFGITFSHHDAALQGELDSVCDAVSGYYDAAAVRACFETYLATDIDERTTGEIWGLYVTSIIMRFASKFRSEGPDL